MPSIYEKFKALREQEAIARKDSDDIQDPIAAHGRRVDADAALDKIFTFYMRITESLTEQQRDELFPRLKEICLSKIPQNEYDRFQRSGSKAVLDTDKKREQFIYYLCPNGIIKPGATEEMVKEIENHLPEEVRNKITEDMDNYVSPVYNNIAYPYMKKNVDERKARNETEIADPEQRRIINAELDEVNEIVLASPQKYCDAHGDAIDKIYDQIKNKRNDSVANEDLEKEEYRKYKDYFEVEEQYNGIRVVNKENVGNVNMSREFCEPNVKVIVPEKNKAIIRKVIGLMRQYGMLHKDENGDEASQGGKAYGFRNIGEAHNRLSDAVDHGDLNEIREAKAQYKREIEHMREIFRIIREELKPTPEMAVGNVNNFRDVWAPAEFKDNVVVNGIVNGIYNLASSLDYAGVELDDVLDNPNETFMEMIKNNAEKVSIDRRSAGMSSSESVEFLFTASAKTEYPSIGIGRNMEILSQLSLNPNDRELEGRNTIGTMLLMSYNNYVGNLNMYAPDASIDGYFRRNADNTLANIMLVNDADRQLSKLRGFEALSGDGTSKIPPFDTIAYMETHEIDPAELVSRIEKTVLDISQTQKNISLSDRALVVMGAQKAALLYTQLHSAPDKEDVAATETYNKLLKMVEDPYAAFEQTLGVQTLRDEFNKLPKIADQKKTVERRGKDQMKIDRKEAREAEKRYNSRLDKLHKDMDKLAKKIEDGDKAGKDPEDLLQYSYRIIAMEGQMTSMIKDELKRLEEAYSAGKIPKDYFDSRYADVQAVKGHNYRNKHPFGLDEYPTLKQFEKKYASEIKNGEITKEEIAAMHENMMDVARREQNKYNLIVSHAVPKTALKGDTHFHRLDENEQKAKREGEKQLEIIEELDESVYEEDDREPIIIEEVAENSKVERVEKIDDNAVKSKSIDGKQFN